MRPPGPFHREAGTRTGTSFLGKIDSFGDTNEALIDGLVYTSNRDI